jgi:hypothetical protein
MDQKIGQEFLGYIKPQTTKGEYMEYIVLGIVVILAIGMFWINTWFDK